MTTKLVTTAVADYLTTLLKNVNIQRSYFPLADLAALDELDKPLILIVPVEKEVEKITQGGTTKNDFIIDVVVNAKLQQVNNTSEISLAEFDELFEIAEKIHDSFLKKIVKESNGNRFVFEQPEHLVLCDFDSVQDRNCFLSIVRIRASVIWTPKQQEN
jgi:hypothetical protein